jgi:hypothetical protein
MTQIADLFDPRIMFSLENPFLKSAEKAHRLVFESFDKSARLQLSYAEDLLDLNRQRFDALYTGYSLMDRVAAHKDLATEVGKRTATWAGDLQEVVVDLGSSITDAANDLVAPAKKTPAARAKKAKAA